MSIPTTTTTTTTNSTNTQQEKKKKTTTSTMIEKSDYTTTLSPISILRRCESVGSEKAYLALDSESKYRDQWMKQASDFLNDSDRKRCV